LVRNNILNQSPDGQSLGVFAAGPLKHIARSNLVEVRF